MKPGIETKRVLTDEQREASRKKNAAYYSANREKCCALSRAWQKNNPERVRSRKAKDYYRPGLEERREAGKERALMRRYGLTLAARDALLASQAGVCGICGEVVSFRLGSACVDHCHGTGRVRGILCAPCNSAIGRLGDDEAGLQRALDYLRCSR